MGNAKIYGQPGGGTGERNTNEEKERHGVEYILCERY